MARLAAPDATAATTSVARPVVPDINGGRLRGPPRAGSGDNKREVTSPAPQFAPPGPARQAMPTPGDERYAIVVGARLAGCATAMALAERGGPAPMLERLFGVAGATLGNRAGIFHGVVTGSTARTAAASTAAALYSRGAGVRTKWRDRRTGASSLAGGVLRSRIARRRCDLAARQIVALGLPPQYV